MELSYQTILEYLCSQPGEKSQVQRFGVCLLWGGAVASTPSGMCSRLDLRIDSEGPIFGSLLGCEAAPACALKTTKRRRKCTYSRWAQPARVRKNYCQERGTRRHAAAGRF